jgi:hypothetical protein
MIGEELVPQQRKPSAAGTKIYLKYLSQMGKAVPSNPLTLKGGIVFQSE